MENSKPKKEDINVWESERELLLKDPIKYKNTFITELSNAARLMAEATCDNCLFSNQCDGYSYSPHCMNPSANFIDIDKEVTEYLEFLLQKGWEKNLDD